jgi:hypothetical protein
MIGERLRSSDTSAPPSFVRFIPLFGGMPLFASIGVGQPTLQSRRFSP